MSSAKSGSAGQVADEFNTNVGGKDERKRLRKRRIEKRNAVDTKNVEEVQEIKIGTTKTGNQQVSDSVFHLDRRKYSGLQDVTSVRVKTDNAEAKRRVEDEGLRRDRLTNLQHEALTSAKANAAIEMKWAELLEKEIPQELHHDIQAQMSACTSIIHSKDELITDFQRQLRGKDEEYVRTLRQQAEDIEELLTRIRKEFKELQGEYDKELNAIEDAYIEERERTITEHTSDIDAMFDLRRNKEIYYKESKQKREDQYQRDVDDLITKGADQYSKLKIELEMNIQTLKQQLEEIRATYQLNTEKLDYNYRVLTELDVEKNAELTRYKRRLNKLKDQLNQFVTRFTEMEAADSKLNNELTDDYRSLTQKYKDLQAKFRHFEVADTGKYDEVWAMHEEEVKDMVDQLLKADKIISEQQLGWRWRSPDMQALQVVLGRHGSLGTTGGVIGDGAAGGPNNNNFLGSSSEEDGGEMMREPLSSTASHRKVAGARVKAVLRMLASEAGFLMNPDVQKSLADLPVEEAEVSKAESMLKALGVKSEERLNSLVDYFFRDNSQGLAIHSDPDGLEDNLEELKLHNAPEDVMELQEMIRAEDVVAAVKAYMEDVTLEAGGTAAVTGGKSSQEDIRIGQKRLNSMRNYWQQLAQVVSDEAVSVWSQLEKDSHTLRDLVTQRTTSIAEMDSLNEKNVELKKLLNTYLGDSNNNDLLQVPPAQVMRVRMLPSSTTHANVSAATAAAAAAAGGAAGGGGGSKKKAAVAGKTGGAGKLGAANEKNVLFSQTR